MMRIGILSREPRNYSSRRLKEAAEARGHTVKVLDTLRFGIYVEEQQPDLSYQTKSLPHYDAIIPRIGASITFFGTAVVRQFEQMGTYCLNPSLAITVSRDKLRSLQVLSRHDIGIPSSAFVRQRRDVLPAIEEVGGAPVIIKLLAGTQGVGVILADSIKIAEAIIETLQSAKQSILIQKFVAESKGKDIRAIVIGDHVVAAMRRRAAGQEFRSNVHRGGSVEQVNLSEEYERTAVKAAQIMGLKFAGVDMLESDDGPSVMEVNSSPGLEGIEKATNIDVAGKVVQYIEEQVRFGDVDIKQRLRLARGYSVTELPITNDSSLAYQTLAEASLRERDIMVLSVDRQGLVLPVPTAETQMLPGDTLVCYGKQSTLRELLPTKKKKPKRKKKAKVAKKASGEPKS
jgi:ribosomal protein S6--L-glutamate ligase